MAIQQPVITEPKRHRFTVVDYYRMADAGIFHEDSRVELIDGEIIDMVPIGPRHSDGVNRLTERFILDLRGAVYVSSQNPIRLDEHNEPEPDLVLARRRERGYAHGHPTPEDVHLVVEVADSSASYDRQTKASLYARFGIPDYWIMDVGREHVLVHRDPTPGGYATTRVYLRGEQLSPLAFPDLTLSIDEILG